MIFKNIWIKSIFKAINLIKKSLILFSKLKGGSYCTPAGLTHESLAAGGMPDMQMQIIHRSQSYRAVVYLLSGVKVKANRLSPPAPATAPWALPAAYLLPQIMLLLSNWVGERRMEQRERRMSQAKYLVHAVTMETDKTELRSRNVD